MIQKVSPSAVAELGRASGRVDDVREQQRRQHPIGVGPRSDAGEELLDLADQLIDALGIGELIGTRQLDEPRAPDRRRPSRDCSTGTIGLPVRFSISVGAWTLGRASSRSASMVWR